MGNQPSPSNPLALIASGLLLPLGYAWFAFLLSRAGHPGPVNSFKTLPDLVQIGILLGCPLLAFIGAAIALRLGPQGRIGEIVTKTAIAVAILLGVMAVVSIAV